MIAVESRCGKNVELRVCLLCNSNDFQVLIYCVISFKTRFLLRVDSFDQTLIEPVSRFKFQHLCLARSLRLIIIICLVGLPLSTVALNYMR